MTENTDAWSSFWTDWMMAVDGIKGVHPVPERILRRWQKEVDVWHEKNKGRETV